MTRGEPWGCPSCSAENPTAAKSCEESGSRLPPRCPQCGYDVGATAKFFLECGHQLGVTSLPTAAQTRPLQSYTPRYLAEKILSARAELEGERKQVTVLFADIKGSTELIEGLDPEEAQALLASAVSAMIEAVHRFEGTVGRVMGDGIMALFGAPLAHEDHGARACYAALTMQEAGRSYRNERQGRCDHRGVPAAWASSTANLRTNGTAERPGFAEAKVHADARC
jgi:hypothetical protein